MSQAKKSFAQHWLRDEATLQRMVEVAHVTSEDTVLEIGPGTGTLTRHLCRMAGSVVAVEADAELASELPERIQADNLHVVSGDILQFDFSTLPPGYTVAANIPYYITSHLLRILGDNANPPAIAVLLLQKELAQRVSAYPGDMSMLSVSVQYFAEPEMLDIVSREMFDPPPQVDSAIVRLTYRESPYFPADTEALFRLVKAGFSERRKKLANALSGGLHVDKPQVITTLEVAGIDPDTRAQELSLDQWHTLYTTGIEQGIIGV